MNNNKAQQFTFLLIIAIVTACAKISAPAGGARDRLPPKVLESSPPNGTVNFDDDRLSVTFDEYVVLDNINEKFMVSPPMKQKPRVYTRGKSVRVEYQDELRDSTTYTFYFMDAIRDLNEGNILPDYRLAVSTGSFIDSLSVTGNVFMLPSLDPPESAVVLLYRNLNDTAVVKLFPDYLSRVDEKGYFRIDNVREGTYRLYALKDDDNSKNYNRSEELFGFMDSVITVTPEKNFLPPDLDTASLKPLVPKKTAPQPVKITKTTSSAKKETEEPEEPEKTGDNRMMMFAPLRTNRYLSKSERTRAYKLTYILSVPPDTMDFDLRLIDIPEEDYMIETTPDRDTVTVWITDSTSYAKSPISTIVRYPFTDSLGIHVYKEDTIPMRFTTPRAPRSGVVKRTMLSLQSNLSGALKPGTIGRFSAETPLRDPDTSKIRLYEIAEKKRIRIPFALTRDSSSSGKLILDTKLEEGKSYLFIADSTSISNIFDEHIDSVAYNFSIRETSSFSKLEVIIDNAGGRNIIQLLNPEEKVLAQSIIEGDGTLTFTLLDKGTYRLRAITDANGDGKWTTGDFFVKRQPEPVTYFTNDIEIPEGWDARETFDLDQKNFKPQKLRKKPNP